MYVFKWFMLQIPGKVERGVFSREQGIAPPDQGGQTAVTGRPDLNVSEAELTLLFSPINWVGNADQTLESEFGRLSAVENRGLNLW